MLVVSSTTHDRETPRSAGPSAGPAGDVLCWRRQQAPTSLTYLGNGHSTVRTELEICAIGLGTVSIHHEPCQPWPLLALAGQLTRHSPLPCIHSVFHQSATPQLSAHAQGAPGCAAKVHKRLSERVSALAGGRQRGASRRGVRLQVREVLGERGR